MRDPMQTYYRHFGLICDEMFNSIVERRPAKLPVLCPWCEERPATVHAYDDTYEVPGGNPLVCETCQEREWEKQQERKAEGA